MKDIVRINSTNIHRFESYWYQHRFIHNKKRMIIHLKDIFMNLKEHHNFKHHMRVKYHLYMIIQQMNHFMMLHGIKHYQMKC